jgi:hypothetical protein
MQMMQQLLTKLLIIWCYTLACDTCPQCGDGLLTDGTGAVSADACFVPPGCGVVRAEGSGAVSAMMCVQNMFGRSTPNYDTRTTR